MEFDTLNEELLSLVDSSLSYGRSLDSNVEYEIYLLYLNKVNVDLTQGVVESNDGVVSGNAVRVVNDKKVSFASSSGVDIKRIKDNIKEALSFNKALTIKDDRFNSFSDPKPGGKEGILSSDLVSASASDLLPEGQKVIDEAKNFDPRINTVGFGVSITWGGFAVANTNDLQRASRSTVSSTYVYCQAVDGDDRKEGDEYAVSREKVPDFQGFGEKAASKAISLLNGRSMKETTSSIPTIWDNHASAAFVRAGLGAGVSGLSVVEGLSPLADKIGDNIASSMFSLTDDGQDPNGLFTQAIDAEGTPQQITSIIEKGILRSFLFNDYYAKIFGTTSTGNCTRGGGIFPNSLPYESTPTIVATNLRVSPGKYSEEELITQVDGRAIYIKEVPMGIFHSNVSTGDFSAVANAAFLVENGEIKAPLKAVSVSGSFYDGLKKIVQVGSNRKVTYLGVETPSLVIEGLSLVL